MSTPPPPTTTTTLPPSLTLHQKTALVTGGTRGIGKGIALELARRGANIAITYTDAKKSDIADETVEEIRALGVKAVAVRADLSVVQDWGVVVEECLGGLGGGEGTSKGIDILVHNAAQMHIGPTPAMTPSLFTSILTTNLTGPYFLTQACLPHMSPGSRIILISSTSARIASMGAPMSVYSASKAALEALARGWAYEFGPLGITVNAVEPGLTETETSLAMTSDAMTRVRENYAKITPFGRAGTPDDVAQIVAFLASEGARWVTGSTVSASGGRVLV